MKMFLVVISLLVLVGFGVVILNNFWEEEFLSHQSFPFDQPKQVITPEIQPFTISEEKRDWQVFESKDKSFRFRYPPSWQLNENFATSSQNNQGVFKIVIQSWSLTNAQGENVSATGEIKADFEIYMTARRETLDNLLKCNEINIMECQNLVINGVTYKRVVSKSAQAKNIILATIKDGKVYRVTSSVNLEKGEEGVRQIEEVMETFEVVQLS